MDEIDAALDFKNVSIVANYIKERTKNAQFIIISLRNNMFELADRLIGIYKTQDVTKSIAINPKEIGTGSGSMVTAPITTVTATTGSSVSVGVTDEQEAVSSKKATTSTNTRIGSKRSALPL